MLTDSAAFILAIGILFIGVIGGFVIQRVAVMARVGDDWEEFPPEQKWALSAVGSIAAFAAGAYMLSVAPSFQPDKVLWKLWLVQAFAAWLGPAVLDVGAQIMIGILRSRGGKG